MKTKFFAVGILFVLAMAVQVFWTSYAQPEVVSDMAIKTMQFKAEPAIEFRAVQQVSHAPMWAAWGLFLLATLGIFWNDIVGCVKKCIELARGEK